MVADSDSEVGEDELKRERQHVSVLESKDL